MFGRLIAATTALALGLSALATAPATSAFDIIIEPVTYYVGHADEAGSYTGACATPDFETDGSWENGGGVGAYNSDNDAIQDAIDGAAEYDTVFVCAGTYLFGLEEELDKDEDVTLVGAGIDETILDGNYHSRFVDAVGDPNTWRISAMSLLYADVGDYDYRNGAALLVESLIVDEIEIVNADGGYNGGAIYAEGEYVSITDSVFSSNQTEEDGAALYAWNPDGTVIVEGSTFTSNSAGESGDGTGGALNVAGDLEVLDSVFTGNFADHVGGAILAQRDFSISGSSFTSNEADNGGALFANGVGAVGSIVSSTFRLNGAATGGAIDANDLAELAITRSLFAENGAYYFGGALQADRIADLRIDRSRFVENHSDGGIVFDNGNGGAADLCGVAELTLTASVFQENVSTGAGGAVGFFGGGCIEDVAAEIRGNTFSGNRSDGNGGAIWMAGEIRDFSQNRFLSNEAGGSGGAVFAAYRDMDFQLVEIGTMTANRFVGNVSGNDGGAMALFGSVDAMTRNTFRRNSARYLGGAVISFGQGWETWSGARKNRFIRNESGSRGAAIMTFCSFFSHRESARLLMRNRFARNLPGIYRREGPVAEYNYDDC
jgi:predicted outer membrane repeat protein